MYQSAGLETFGIRGEACQSWSIRSRLTYSNVVSTLALFLVLAGGAAYGASHLAKNSVGTPQLKKNAVTGAKIRNGTITGRKIKLSSLGTVPNAGFAARAADADTLQGSGADSFVRGGGQILSARRDLGVGDSGVPMFTIPGLGPVTANCSMGTTHAEGGFEFTNQSGSVIDNSLIYGVSGVDGGQITPGQTTGLGGFELVGAWRWQLATRSSPSTLATLSFGFDGNATPTACAMFAQATVGTG
ncbi:MAG TPA: hypothetical protein VGF04_03295 [Solirubrobacterales bacterium]